MISAKLPVLLFFAAVAVLATPLPPNPTTGDVNVLVELALTAANDYPVPLVDVNVSCDFTLDASGRVLSRGAFFDGGGVFRLRFAPARYRERLLLESEPENSGSRKSRTRPHRPTGTAAP